MHGHKSWHKCKPAEMFFRWFHKILKKRNSSFLLVSHEWARWALSPCFRLHRFTFTNNWVKEGIAKGVQTTAKQKKTTKKSLRWEVLAHVMVESSWRKQLIAAGIVEWITGFVDDAYLSLSCTSRRFGEMSWICNCAVERKRERGKSLRNQQLN